MKFPAIIVNLKNEKGSKAAAIAQACDEVAQEFPDITIGVAPLHEDAQHIVGDVGIPVFTQFLDELNGYQADKASKVAKEMKLAGSIVNHSDRRVVDFKRSLAYDGLERSIAALKDDGLTSICCSADYSESLKIATLGPDIVAYEPPFLIGGNRSVSRDRPDILKKLAYEIEDIDSRIGKFCGAGMKKGEDFSLGRKYGMDGFLVSSAVTSSYSPRRTLKEFCLAMYNKNI